MDEPETPPTTLDQSVFRSGSAMSRSSSVRSRPSSVREARIQEELNFRRSQSAFSVRSLRSLSNEEEDELEAKSGDSGTAYVVDSELLRNSGAWSAEFSAERLSNAMSGHMPSGALVLPVTSSPPPGPGGQLQEPPENLHSPLEFISVLSHLAVFGILGVIIRYLSEILFGQSVGKVTSSNSALFVDLPANMLGSFFMGWCGVVFKQDIAMFSEHLALGLSTGLMGSITTYAAMIQSMLMVMVKGQWVVGFFGLLIGVQIAQMSLVVGVDSANYLRKILEQTKLRRPSPDNLHRRTISLVIFLFWGLGFWVASGVLSLIDKTPTSRRTLWVACFLAPPGVWTRWYLARLNGQGLGSKHHLRWLPVGTFLANILASSLEEGLSTVQLSIGTYTGKLLVGGIKLGTLGCMSTVSTFVAEIQIMHQGKNAWRAYVYPVFTMSISFLIGILAYGVPVWCHRVHTT